FRAPAPYFHRLRSVGTAAAGQGCPAFSASAQGCRTIPKREALMSRAMWSGSLNFGLVTIPVRLHAAVRDRGIHFHQVDSRDRSRIRYKVVNERTGHEVDRAHLVKCYEIAPDECVILTQQELRAAAPEASRSIEIQTFIALSEIDPVYFERPYYLVPEPHAAKAYHLLVEAMHKSSRIAIARFV